jgi:hypothetical protein
LILDNFSVHKCASVQTILEQANIDAIFIPGGLTPILQPLDVGINKALKDKIRDAYGRWARNTFNLDVGLGKPHRRDVAQWVSYAWGEISEESIRNSFFWCGLDM